MFRAGIDLSGKTQILKVGLLASLVLLRCQRSLNSLVKCTTSRLLVNCLWTHPCLHINKASCPRQGSHSHTYLYLPPTENMPLFLETTRSLSFPSWLFQVLVLLVHWYDRCITVTPRKGSDPSHYSSLISISKQVLSELGKMKTLESENRM